MPVADSPAYPTYLVPQPMYCWLNNQDLTSGLLIRRTSQPNSVDEAGKLLPDQLSSPTVDLARHFSVNLLGDFQVADTAWVLCKGEAKELLAASWQPGELGQLPTADQAQCLPLTEWGYYWLLVGELHNCEFDSGGEVFTCQVCHAPTRSNYWHFELHFYTKAGDVYSLEDKQRKKVAPKIRAWLQDYVYTHPPEAVPSIAAWPESLYISSQLS